MTPAMFRKLAALGLSNEQMAGVLEVIEETKNDAESVLEANKEKARERWRKWKQKQHDSEKQTFDNVCQTFANVGKQLTGASHAGSNPFSSEPKGSSEIERKEEREEPRVNALASSFEAFWTIFPNKVGKRDAEKAFAKAVNRSPVETIMAGLRRYVSKTDDRPWCNPSTFLNQDRWNDAPAIVAQRQSRPPPRVDGFAQAIREDLERESRRGTQFGDFKHSIESEPERDFSSAVFARVIAAS